MRTSLALKTRIAALSMAAAMLAACSDDADDTDRERDAKLSEPIAIRRDLAFLDAENDAVWWLKLGGRASNSAQLTATETTLPSNPIAASTRSDQHGELVVLTAGLRGVNDKPRVVALDAGGDARKYSMSAPYTKLETSEDGRYAVASFATGAGRRAFSPSQVAVVDLDESAPRSVVEVALESDGRSASGTWLTPVLRAGDRELQFILASFPRQLALLDLAWPGGGPVMLDLTGDLDLALEVEELAYLPDAGRIAVRVRGIDDVFIVALHEERDSDRGYRVELAQWPSGREPLQILARAENSLVSLTDGGGELWSIDAATGQSVVRKLDKPSGALLQCTRCRYALGYTLGETTLNLIELERLTDAEGDAAVRSLRAVASVSRVVIDEDHQRGYLIHDGGAVTLVSLDSGRLSPLSAPASAVESLQLAPDGAAWFATRGDYLVTRFDPESQAAREVLLSRPFESLVFMPEIRRAVVMHSDPELSLSVLDALEPRSVDAQELRGPR